MDINETYVMSTLSEATYADFTTALQPDGSFSASDVKAALIASDFSGAQANAFITQWRVVDHQPNTLLSGFSATLFERLDANQLATGDYTLAIRGTELSALDPRDLAGLGTVLGSFTPVFIEESTLAPENHRIGRLSDALAVYDLFGQLAPTASLATLSGILAAFSATPANSLEAAVSSLGRLLGISGTARTECGASV